MAGVSKWYDAFQVLKKIDLQVNDGDRVVICGPSGSGKSTLIRCINGLEPFQEGTIDIKGLPLSRRSKATDPVRANVGMVFQQFNLFPHLTALENCMLAQVWAKKVPRKEAREVAMDQLAQVRIADKADRYPSQLSGGQQQRVAIARALCLKPSIMLFDEATSSLDPEMVKEVLDTMMMLAKGGMTMVCVTHEMGFARAVANKVVFMDHGEVIEDGTPDAFFSHTQNERARRFLSQIL